MPLKKNKNASKHENSDGESMAESATSPNEKATLEAMLDSRLKKTV
jgi:hypothetical protein